MRSLSVASSYGEYVPPLNYRQMKKQREAAQRSRQEKKQQRRQKTGGPLEPGTVDDKAAPDAVSQAVQKSAVAGD
jgi:hypothetical protein